jgi:hypothetical protein
MWRKIIGVVLGIVLANLLIWGWEAVLLPLTPFAKEGGTAAFDLTDVAEQLPIGAQVWVAAGWTLGAFAGALAAFRIGHSDLTGWLVAGLVGAASVANVLLIEHPLWMRLWAVAGSFIGALFAFGVWRRWRAALLHLRHPPSHDGHWH